MTMEKNDSLKFVDGRHIRAARIIAGLTRGKLAVAANLHPNSIKYWENDTSPCWPGGPAINKISSALASVGVETEVVEQDDCVVAIIRKS
jgi:hypothetical protein